MKMKDVVMAAVDKLEKFIEKTNAVKNNK